MKTKGSETLAHALTNIDHQQAADMLGVTRACLYTWRRGRGTPNVNNRAALEKLFAIPPIHWFVSLDATTFTREGA
jgi:hypothetical protein